MALRPGFDAHKQMVHCMVVPSFHGYRGERLNAFYEEFRRRLQSLPGVKQATYAARVPLQDVGSARATEVVIPGYELPPGADSLRIRCALVGPNYFQTLGTRLRGGRPVDERDTLGGLPVAVINESMARRFWPGEDPIGRAFLMGKDRTEVRIIGTAEDTRIRRLHETPEPYLFLALAQSPQSEATYALETAGDPRAMLGAVKAEVRNMEKSMSILGMGTLAELMDRALYDERLAAWVVGSLAGLGLVLGAIGLYGVVALATGRRTREVGIRLALGATHRNVLDLVIRQGVGLALVGIVVGLGGSLAATRWIASRLYGVSRFDPATFAAVALLLALVAALASYFPARRAARVSPIQALRYE